MTAEPALDANHAHDASDWIESNRSKTPSLHALDNTERTGSTHKVLLKIPIPDQQGLKINQMVDIKAILSKIFETNHDIKLISNDNKYQICNI